MKKSALNGLTFSDETLAGFHSTTDIVNNRFNRWLVSRKIATPFQSDLFGLQTDIQAIDQKIQNEADNRRELLEIEKGQEQRISKLKDKKDLLIKVNKMFQARLYKNLRLQVAPNKNLLEKHLKLNEDLSFLFENLFSASVTYNKIWSGVAAIPNLDVEIARLLNDESFCASIGRTPPSQKVNGKEAIGLLGVDASKVIISLLIMKLRLNPRTQHFPLSNDKLWSIITTAGHTAYLLLKELDYREPVKGFLLAGCSMLGHISILNMFDEVFNQTKNDFMIELRERNAMDMYFAATDVTAHPVVLAEMFVQHGTSISNRVLKEIKWQQLPQIRDAITEENNRVNMTQRSLFGQVLKQALHFSKFIVLKESRQFSSSHTRPYLYSAYLDNKTIKWLLKANVKNLDLNQFFG